jgi:hypothetical protein
MAKTARNLAIAGAVASAALAMPQASMAADVTASTAPPMSHIRTTDANVAAVMQDAFDGSPTFRKLVAKIDASDSYVYVQDGKCSHSVRACFVSVTASDTHRFMRVVVDGSRGDAELMGLIGHELRHTIEVIAEPGIRSTAAKYLFYERTAMHDSGGTHETRAAIKAGETVRSEVGKWNRNHPTRSCPDVRRLSERRRGQEDKLDGR